MAGRFIVVCEAVSVRGLDRVCARACRSATRGARQRCRLAERLGEVFAGVARIHDGLAARRAAVGRLAGTAHQRDDAARLSNDIEIILCDLLAGRVEGDEVGLAVAAPKYIDGLRTLNHDIRDSRIADHDGCNWGGKVEHLLFVELNLEIAGLRSAREEAEGEGGTTGEPVKLAGR